MSVDLKQNDSMAIQQQVGLLNIRIADTMNQLNVVLKLVLDANIALQKENAELKAKQDKD